ncbi:transposase [Sessilibacter sp. MAH1]
MTKPRSEQVSIDDTPFYHCMVRCVRRAFLCGDDHETGENFDHRKQWLVSRLRFLSYVYAIDICAYAVMSNHYHVILHVDKRRAETWSLDEVVERWLQLYKGDKLIQKWIAFRAEMSKSELKKAENIIEQWRERLTSISWFMRGVNETIARMANEEDNCKGRFWEGRFKSQALLDEQALLTCMAYVDLNPVRAGIADDLIDSDFTSIQQRIFDFVNAKNTTDKNSKQEKNSDTSEEKINLKLTKSNQKRIQSKVKKQQKTEKLLQLDSPPKSHIKPFHGSVHTDLTDAIPITFADYLELVETTGRCIREDKRGFISDASEKTIHTLGLNLEQWITHVKNFSSLYASNAGSKETLKIKSAKDNKRWYKGIGLIS